MANPPGKPQETTHLLDYVRVILKRLWLIVGVFVLVVGVVGFATWRATPMYRATALINIRQPNVGLGKFDSSELLSAMTNSQMYLNTQYRLLSQRATVLAMVEKHGLDKWPEFQGKSPQEIARSLTGNIAVDPQRETTLVRVSVVDARQRIVHRIVNNLVDTFAEMQAREAKSDIEDVVNKLESRYLEFNGKTDLLRNRIQRILETNNMDQATFLESFEYQRSRLRRHQELVDKTTEDIAGKKPLYDQISSALAEGGGGIESLFGHPYVMRDEAILQFEEEIILLRRDLLAFQQEGLGPESPEVLRLERQVADKELLRDKRKRLLLLGYAQDYEALVQTRDILERQLEDTQGQYSALSETKRDYDVAEAEIERWQTEAARYNTLWEKLQSSRSEEIRPVVIEDLAQQPFAPFKPDKQLNMILAIVFGLIGGVGLAFFLEYLDDTIKTKEELQRITDVPLFGVIPNISARRGETQKKDLYAYNQPKSTISEAFRGIRTAISYSSQKQENRVYLVTSSGPKEGKSTIAINVATVMAYSGTRTLIVDADLRKPRVHKSFELNNTKGLTNLIIGDVTVEDVVQPTSIDNLFVLPSGPIPPNPSELLGRPRMLEVLEELRGRFDRILLDTPPIGAVTDAAVLGRIVDSVILVVHAGKTRKKLIERGLEQLAQIDVDVSGIVLNNLKIGRKRYYPGYYHYYYYYSSYYGTEEKPRAKGKSKQQA